MKRMLKKNLKYIIITATLVATFMLGCFVEYLYLDISKYHTEKVLKGTYAEPFPSSTGGGFHGPLPFSIAILDENTVLYCDDSNVCKEGEILRIGGKMDTQNVYNFVFADETIHVAYYEDEMLVIKEDFASIF